jgi:hypothetical protein
MQRPGVLLGVAGAAFLVFLVTGVPASLITKLAPAELQISNPRGSLWSGQASSIRFGSVRLGQTSWKLRPVRLLLGSLAGQIDASLPGGFARGSFVLGLGGSIALSDFSAASPLANLAASLGTSLPIDQGELSLDLQALDIEDGWPTRAVGDIRVDNVALVFRGGRPVPEQAASFLLNLAAEEVPEDGTLLGSVSDQGGPLEMVGELRLTPPTNYELSGRAKPRPSAPEELGNALVMLGPENASGGRDFTFAGSL